MKTGVNIGGTETGKKSWTLSHRNVTSDKHHVELCLWYLTKAPLSRGMRFWAKHRQFEDGVPVEKFDHSSENTERSVRLVGKYVTFGRNL